MKMDALKLARRTANRRLGWSEFRRNCRLTAFGGRQCKAWRVPGTPEAGRDAMLSRMVADEANRLYNGEPGIHGSR